MRNLYYVELVLPETEITLPRAFLRNLVCRRYKGFLDGEFRRRGYRRGIHDWWCEER